MAVQMITFRVFITPPTARAAPEGAEVGDGSRGIAEPEPERAAAPRGTGPLAVGVLHVRYFSLSSSSVYLRSPALPRGFALQPTVLVATTATMFNQQDRHHANRRRNGTGAGITWLSYQASIH